MTKWRKVEERFEKNHMQKNKRNIQRRTEEWYGKDKNRWRKVKTSGGK